LKLRQGSGKASHLHALKIDQAVGFGNKPDKHYSNKVAEAAAQGIRSAPARHMQWSGPDITATGGVDPGMRFLAVDWSKRSAIEPIAKLFLRISDFCSPSARQTTESARIAGEFKPNLLI
jgi:hypothetical protein